MLNGAAPTAQSTIDGTTFTWAQGLVADHGYVKGLSLITRYQDITTLEFSWATLRFRKMACSSQISPSFEWRTGFRLHCD